MPQTDPNILRCFARLLRPGGRGRPKGVGVVLYRIADGAQCPTATRDRRRLRAAFFSFVHERAESDAVQRGLQAAGGSGAVRLEADSLLAETFELICLGRDGHDAREERDWVDHLDDCVCGEAVPSGGAGRRAGGS